MLNLAAATHFLASNYREPGRKAAAPSLFEFDRTPHALRDVLFEVPVVVKNGVAQVPTGPGLGVVVNRQALKSDVVSKRKVK